MLANVKNWPFEHSFSAWCGGEALQISLAENLLNRELDLWNLYGPTETTIWSTIQNIKELDDIPSIGNAIANTQIYITNTNLEPQSIGVPGELLIGGTGVGRGYLNRPELTAEKFIDNPFVKDVFTAPVTWHAGCPMATLSS